MNITKMLTISTAHITRETEKKLRVESYSNNMCLSVYDKEGYGYWIYIDPYDKLMCKENIDVIRQVLENFGATEIYYNWGRID